MKKKMMCIALVLSVFVLWSQEPNDAANATQVCGDIDFTYIPTGPGADDFASNPNPTCLPNDSVESQSVWLNLDIDSSGVVGFPKFFTPNNDGYNDIWQIKGVTPSFFESSQVYIFDRFGKLITSIDPQSGWDGIYNGEILPSSDYWFTAELTDRDGNLRSRRGHFSLIRR